jgi:hypothetical protein
VWTPLDQPLFSEETFRPHEKLALFRAKDGNNFANFFGENIYKNITLTPGPV